MNQQQFLQALRLMNTEKTRPTQNLLDRNKNPYDEFFTLPETVENEIPHYAEQLKGKRIFLPCDNQESAFWQHFEAEFLKV